MVNIGAYVDEVEYYIIGEGAKAENRSISNFVGTAAIHRAKKVLELANPALAKEIEDGTVKLPVSNNRVVEEDLDDSDEYEEDEE